jgi:hypothetical protein
MKCEICSQNVKETFLKKILGTYVKDAKGKKHIVCQLCQKQNQGKKRIIELVK